MIAAAKGDNPAFLGEKLRRGQGMQVRFGPGVGKSHSLEAEPFAHGDSKPLFLGGCGTDIHPNVLEDIAYSREYDRIRVAVQRSRELGQEICVPA